VTDQILQSPRYKPEHSDKLIPCSQILDLVGSKKLYSIDPC